MDPITIDAGTLTANRETRTVTGLLLPVDEECRSNLGRFAFNAGAVTVPPDLAGTSLNVEHRREDVVGAPISVTETERGLVATFKLAATPAGDQALADIESGKRKHLSAEVANVKIKDGRGISGDLFAAALVAEPAFPSATLLAAAADTVSESSYSDTYADGSSDSSESTTTTSEEELEDGTRVITRTTVTKTTITPATDPAPAPDAAAAITDTAEFSAEQEDAVSTATAPNTLTASKPKEKGPLTLHDVDDILFAHKSGRMSFGALEQALAGQNSEEGTLFAALNDVKFDGVGGLQPTLNPIPQWMGEVWSAVQYRQQVLPLLGHKDLTALTLTGFRWTTKPAGGDWAGNKGAVPSNTLVAAPVTGNASRYAIGHDIAREFIDFPVPGFFESYAAAVAEDYARWADGKVTAAILGGATILAGDALPTLPGNPAAAAASDGGTIGRVMSAIIDGAAALVVNGVLPKFALLNPADWKKLVKAPKSNTLGYLNAALGLPEGSLDGAAFTLRPSAAVAAGKVLVGVPEAATVYELPGAPVRMDAVDIARGGIDKAAFGYCGVVINDALGLQLVSIATA